MSSEPRGGGLLAGLCEPLEQLRAARHVAHVEHAQQPLDGVDLFTRSSSSVPLGMPPTSCASSRSFRIPPAR
jgi:hypothetical protein